MAHTQSLSTRYVQFSYDVAQDLTFDFRSARKPASTFEKIKKIAKEFFTLVAYIPFFLIGLFQLAADKVSKRTHSDVDACVVAASDFGVPDED